MFLNLQHKKLVIYETIKQLVSEVYKTSALLPAVEKFNLIQQVQRAALSVKLTFAEGSSRRSSIERKRYFEIARGSVIELDAAFETAVDLGYLQLRNLTTLNVLLNKCFAMLSGCIKNVNSQTGD